jgi:hypothetical protein
MTGRSAVSDELEDMVPVTPEGKLAKVGVACTCRLVQIGSLQGLTHLRTLQASHW